MITIFRYRCLSKLTLAGPKAKEDNQISTVESEANNKKVIK